MTGSRLIVALDYATADEALKFAARVTPAQCRLKIGLELFTAAGPELVGRLAERGYDVFLDLKYHDIPHTVARACARAAELGVWMVTVHTLGGNDMLRAAREAGAGARRRPLLVGVTMLTSLGPADAAAIGLPSDVARQVERLAGLARAAGLDGVVCSPQELQALRARFGKDFLLVTPGIRPAGTAADDQRRTMTPAEAVSLGSDFLVVGRPITRAADPPAALEEIRRQMAAA
ncbi:MAG: orotidine 5'-phosphate decarboxylase [Candidatus Muproteobacteria bacterium RBG_16_65_31]|uniref:Orotidine 5'-phosphate decarboxylase n=1 Tax=Candidatus Muproteobacteria bacterium RBG_16_65_31 TaxID=1817759 RepID=A0A1F6TFP8_9PROT|nr:MAG: orotidine 5'-phosphate decarboxylase [Candidatus Muproteobacteria bacterium RBG_16_65_31]